MRRIAIAFAALQLAACAPEPPQLVRRPESPSSALLIREADVLDVETLRVERGRDVLVQNGRIAAIGLAGQLAAPEGARRIDAAGATLLPGLVDVHGHLYVSSAPTWHGAGPPDPEATLRSHLYAGVTTILDPHDPTGEAFERRERVARGELLGPRIYSAGLALTAPDGHPVALMRQLLPFWLAWYAAPRAARQVASPEEARAAVQDLAAAGADFLKVMVDRIPFDAPRLPVPVLEAAVAEARSLGLRAVAHIGTFEDARDAARAGVAAWVHGVYKERLSDEQIAELAAFGIPMAPTLTVFESYGSLLDENRVATKLEREVAPADVLAAFNEVPEDNRRLEAFRFFLEALSGLREAGRDNVRRLHAAGVVILAGSDPQAGVFAGPGLHRELRLLVAAGLSPAQAIRAATLDAARFVSGEGDPDFGQVKLGKRADLLLVDGDPTLDISASEAIRAVILGGVPLERIPIGS